jgi:hypothetical protein
MLESKGAVARTQALDRMVMVVTKDLKVGRDPMKVWGRSKLAEVMEDPILMGQEAGISIPE